MRGFVPSPLTDGSVAVSDTSTPHGGKKLVVWAACAALAATSMLRRGQRPRTDTTVAVGGPEAQRALRVISKTLEQRAQFIAVSTDPATGDIRRVEVAHTLAVHKETDPVWRGLVDLRLNSLLSSSGRWSSRWDAVTHTVIFEVSP